MQAKNQQMKGGDLRIAHAAAALHLHWSLGTAIIMSINLLNLWDVLGGADHDLPSSCGLRNLTEARSAAAVEGFEVASHRAGCGIFLLPSGKKNGKYDQNQADFAFDGRLSHQA
jgi:hypothetical protein